MKKNIKLFVGILIGIIISTVVGVSATILYQADEIGFTPSNPNWNVNNLEDALNDLYTNRGSSATKFCTFVTSEYGDSNNHLSVGSKYSCDPGDGTPRNFYILVSNSDTIKLIMDSNITNDTMTWHNAMKYFDNQSIRATWINVQNVDLPMAQDIANALGGNWIASDNNNTYRISTQWITYTSHGFWTRDGVPGTSYAWYVAQDMIDIGTVSYNQYNSVRPVITVLKDNLQG